MICVVNMYQSNNLDCGKYYLCVMVINVIFTIVEIFEKLMSCNDSFYTSCQIEHLRVTITISVKVEKI